MVVGCKAPSAVESTAKTVVPEAFSTNTDTTTIATMQWRISLLIELTKFD
jgi:hypothetical protein